MTNPKVVMKFKVVVEIDFKDLLVNDSIREMMERVREIATIEMMEVAFVGNRDKKEQGHE